MPHDVVRHGSEDGEIDRVAVGNPHDNQIRFLLGRDADTEAATAQWK